MSVYDYGTIVFYFLFVGAIGLVFKRLNRNSSDYFAGGFQVTWWLLGASVFVSNISAWTFTGAAHIAYTYGTVIFVITVTDILGYVLGYAWFAPRLRQIRVVTAMLAVRKRFSRQSEQVYTWFSIVGSMVTATVWMIAVSVVLSSIFEIPQTATILCTGATVAIMSLYGGRWAVIASDFIQLGLLLSVSLAVFFLAAYRLGGLEAYFEAIPETLLNPALSSDSPYDIFWVFGFILLSLVARNNLTTAFRYNSAKDSKHARWSALIPIIGYLILPICWFTVPMVAGAFIQDIEAEYSMLEIPAEASYFAVAINVLPNGLLGLLVACVIASTMSSMDSALNRNAGYFVKSVYEPFIRKNRATQGELLHVGRITTVFFAVLVIGISILVVERGQLSLFDMYQQLNGRLTVPMAVPVFWGLFARRIPKWGPWVSLVFGLLVSSALFDGLDTGIGRMMLGWFFRESSIEYIVAHPVTWSYLVNIPLTSIVFWCTGIFFKGCNDDYKANVERFFEDLERPVDFEKEVGKDNTAFQAKTVGWLALVYGGFVSVLLLVPNPIEGRIAIAGVALVMLGVGAGLTFYARRVLAKNGLVKRCKKASLPTNHTDFHE
ncbi:MAG: sodium:solute symporter family transporter [Opitutales bacterium]